MSKPGRETPGSASPRSKIPQDPRLSLPARSGSEILLLVLGAINTEAVQWEEMGNHSLRLSGGNLGFYGVSVPSVPLFTGGWGPEARALRNTSSFVVGVRRASDLQGNNVFTIPPPILKLHLLTTAEFVCLSQVLLRTSAPSQELRGISRNPSREEQEQGLARLCGCSWDRWEPWETLPLLI